MPRPDMFQCGVMIESTFSGVALRSVYKMCVSKLEFKRGKRMSLVVLSKTYGALLETKLVINGLKFSRFIMVF